MRKLLMTLLMAAVLLLAVPALADTVLNFESIYAQCTLDDSSYILLTRENLDQHQEWMSARGMTNESLLSDWDARGVLAQAWSTANDACMEFTAVHDETSDTYFDLDAQTPEIRSKYRTGHLKGTLYGGEGYNFDSAEWKKTTQYGRFLMLKYKRTVGDTVYRGFARRAVRNGYTITVDYKVYGRALKNADLRALNKLMDTWHFTRVLVKGESGVAGTSGTSAASSVSLTAVFSQEPPAESNTGKFTVKGTCNPNLHIIATLMRMSGSSPLHLETDATKKGAFSFAVTLPEEGVWLMTLTYLDNGQTVGETVFNSTNYKQTLLPVNLQTAVPEVFASDQFVLSGTTDKQTTIQCIVTGSLTMDKQVRTNNSGAFSFKLDTSMEGDYTVTLTFQKKGYDERRYRWTARRVMSEEERIARIKASAIKPAYANLTAKLKNYVGRVMTYPLYVAQVTQTNDEWVVFMAMQTTKSGYKNYVVVTSDHDPGFEVGSQYRIYGRLLGNYEILDENQGTTYYPCFELLFVEN